MGGGGEAPPNTSSGEGGRLMDRCAQNGRRGDAAVAKAKAKAKATPRHDDILLVSSRFTAHDHFPSPPPPPPPPPCPSKPPPPPTQKPSRPFGACPVAATTPIPPPYSPASGDVFASGDRPEGSMQGFSTGEKEFLGRRRFGWPKVSPLFLGKRPSLRPSSQV